MEDAAMQTGVLYLSIHDLTRRSTFAGANWSCIVCLSIHDLTRRSTELSDEEQDNIITFNSRPHKEVDK